jgi:hypothetical protein
LGDERLGDVLIPASLGPYRASRYKRLAEERGVSLEYVYDMNRPVPWTRAVSTEVKPEYLKEEVEKSIRFELTPSCNVACTDCGICPMRL